MSRCLMFAVGMRSYMNPLYNSVVLREEEIHPPTHERIT